MNVTERIKKDRMEAMRSRDTARRGVLDYLLGLIQTEERKPGGADANAGENIVAAFIKGQRQLINTLKESRPHEIPKLEAEILVAQEYLPKELDEAGMKAAVAEAQSGGAATKSEIIKAVKAKHDKALNTPKLITILDELGVK